MNMLCVQREHYSIRSNKGKDECLTSEDYKKMEYTQQVADHQFTILHGIKNLLIRQRHVIVFLLPSSYKNMYRFR
jgi:cytochrome P450 family 724 subfamily B1